MDGLTISNSDALIERDRRSKRFAIPSFQYRIHPRPSIQGSRFADTLKDAVHNVNQQQLESDRKNQELATGKNKNIAEVMITAEKADISLKLMTSVRNKIIEAYQEIMKMQV